MGAAGRQIRQSRNVPKVRVRPAGRIKKRTPDPRNPNKRLLRPGGNNRNPPSPCSKTFYRSRHGADGFVTLFALLKGSETTLKPSTEAADIQLSPHPFRQRITVSTHNEKQRLAARFELTSQ